MTENEFEAYWKANRAAILANSDEYRRAKEEFKVHSGADLILFGIPIVAGIVTMNSLMVQNELLRWLISAAVTVFCFAVCVWIKSMITGTVSPDEVEMRLKDAKKREMTDKE